MPKVIAKQVMELAHRLDSGEYIELDTKSKAADNDFVIKSSFPEDENLTKSELENYEIMMNQESRECNIDFVTKSMPNYSQAIEIAKKILKHKKSARISMAKMISKIYKQSLSSEYLKS
ncbi:Oligopeptide transport system permease protein OppC (plasmid) [Nostoc flagelliforme CCNUN1]|uniref:Oligopeptide transport system permease protein OppC n=1 Tax=Nostoc flagelliforme CCNUN1 TaxID=2038116 RepID=A0A2K8T6X3_9NOSO|nr:hypothetical protein [Nostoc flagelliforme]AUB43447.1 Oligopeptide transport system permease protein OppC [Nostoc flagelliforme CCNUN1]